MSCCVQAISDIYSNIGVFFATDIGADSDLLAMIRGEYSTAENVLRALDTVSAPDVAAAVEAGVACERQLQHRGASSGLSIGSGGANASAASLSLDALERSEEVARQACLEAAFEDDDLAVDLVAEMVRAADESTPGS